MAPERFVGIETPAHGLRQDFDGAIEVPGVRQLDGLVEQAFGIAKA
ncbi:hypothetical protein [Luteitalea pratensis]|nr:hypothetical protein [Luteitalea pratensis]